MTGASRGSSGGGIRERLKALNKEEHYLGAQRLPSHAVHGTWVDLCKHHLEYDAQKDVYTPNPKFSWVDARLLGPLAWLVLDAVKPYVERFFANIPETQVLFERIDDLRKRILAADAVHERLFGKES
jgi:hypothetical protein